MPWIWAKPAYLLNRMSTILASKMDQVFTAVPHGSGHGSGAGVGSHGGGGSHGWSYIPYYETGTVFASKLISKARHFKVTDPTFNGNLERFVNQCVVYGALIGNKYTMKDLLNSDDIWELIRSKASPVMGFSYRTPDDQRTSIFGSTIVTCREGAQKLEAEWAKQLDEASMRYGKAFFPNIKGDAKASFLERLPQSYHLLTNISKDASKLLQQSMMMNAITTAPNKKLSEMGSAMNYATTKTLLQQRSNFAIAGEVARDTLPIIKVVLEALTYASFIFVFFIALLPKGFRVFKTYFEMLLSLQLWPLLYTILNFIMTIYGRWQTGGVIGTGMNLTNASAIAEINADIAAYAGYWSMLVPIFAYMITKGGVSSMVQAAGQIGNAFMSASASAAQEVSGGNISLGNMQYGTESVLNTSGFKHDTGFMHRSNQMETTMSDGTGRVMHENGEVVFKGGAGQTISQMGVRVSSTDHISKMASDSLNHSESVMQSRNEEWSSSRTHAAAELVNNARTIADSINSGKAYDVSEGHSASQSFQNMADFSTQLQNKYGLNTTQSNEITAGLAVGKGGKGADGLMGHLTPNLGFNFRNQAERQATYDDVHSMAEKYGITNSLDKTAQSIEKIHFGDNQSKEARLLQDVSSSYQDSESMRESFSKAQQYHDSMSNLMQTMRSGSLNVEWDENQNLLDYIANQRDHGHRIGHDTAYKMVSRRDPIALSMIESYQQDQWKKIDETIRASDHVLSEAEIQGLYRNPTQYNSMMAEGDQTLSSRQDVKGRFREESSAIINQSELKEDLVRNDAQVAHDQNKQDISHQMDQRHMEMESQRGKTQQVNQKHLDSYITTEMARNLVGGTKKDI